MSIRKVAPQYEERLVTKWWQTGDDLVSNPNLTESSKGRLSDWTLQSGWSWNPDKKKITKATGAAAFSYMAQDAGQAIVDGTSYVVAFSLDSVSSSVKYLAPLLGGVTQSLQVVAAGRYGQVISPTVSSHLHGLVAEDDFAGVIGHCAIKEYTATEQIAWYETTVECVVPKGATAILKLPPAAEAQGRFYSIIMKYISASDSSLTIQSYGDVGAFTNIAFHEAVHDRLLFYCNGSYWFVVSNNRIGDAPTSRAVQEAPNGTRTTFTCYDNFVPGTLQVYQDGAHQTYTTDYAESSTTQFTFTEAPPEEAVIQVTYMRQGG